MKKHQRIAIVFLLITLIITALAGKSFSQMYHKDPMIKGPGVTEVRMLSEYSPNIKGTSSDTEIYILKGEKPGGSVLILGGTHPNEPSGYLTAVLLLENMKPESGTVYIIPHSNASAFTHNDSQEGSPQKFSIKTPWGERWFQYGSRATNPIDQWPDPDVYIHAASGQKLSGSETRNLNRGYPGREDGTRTEQVCFGIVNLINTEGINMTFDLHEASPEYPVNNAIVAHEDAMGIASSALINLQINGIQYGLEPSPPNLRGLTHRELGDYTDTLAILMETANPCQGRLRGKTDATLAVEGKDSGYVKAGKLGYLYVPFDDNGHPISERVARHTEAIMEFLRVFTDTYPDKPIEVNAVPDYYDIINNGIGNYLLKSE
ncbi:M14 family metallopeptidase [Natronincola ferrireducens]|uniref:Succinylglutamate desuccinylase / Aspartoacylase family protein n=1 Tax=Natronincola ferrireducens TaxID=393762 RepID=A0A1G9FRL3_9FIRM|nr:succinylglutamate desuccinylase/aspartoacylase family protein [Natronincola ferrireducens]SDK91044.1 Succinylglutamate desuccinylase / Aspartoacylase family protein [Natronincola ferrireducens]